MIKGDFFQLPPVKAVALYTPIKHNVPLFAYQKKGLAVWHQFDTFAEMTENVRTRFEYLSVLSQNGRSVKALCLNQGQLKYLTLSLSPSLLHSTETMGCRRSHIGKVYRAGTRGKGHPSKVDGLCQRS